MSEIFTVISYIILIVLYVMWIFIFIQGLRENMDYESWKKRMENEEN